MIDPIGTHYFATNIDAHAKALHIVERAGVKPFGLYTTASNRIFVVYSKGANEGKWFQVSLHDYSVKEISNTRFCELTVPGYDENHRL